MKRFLSMALVVILVLAAIPAFAADQAVVNQSKELKVIGNKIVWAEDETREVYLAGLSVYAYDLTKEFERMDRSIIEAFDNWHVNLVRLPITTSVWNKPESKERYKELIAKYVNEASARGKYILIDLHNFGYITQADVDFWKECAPIYANNPSVIYGMLNEPHDISWETWRNGGDIKSKDKEGKEVINKAYGHQELVEIIRDLGAKNILLAGGLDWGYDLRGLVGEGLARTGEPDFEGRIVKDAEVDTKKYFLVDQGSGTTSSKAGNGIIYDMHIYPTKGMKEWSELENRDSVDPCEFAAEHWAIMTGGARKQFPVLSGENGWDIGTMRGIFDSYIKDRTEMLLAMFEPGQQMHHSRWVPALYEYFYDTENYGAPVHTTAWCFAPNSSPVLIEDRGNWGKPDYAYPTSPYWGAYVKDELKRLLGENLVTGKELVDTENFDNAELAVDSDYTTFATKSVDELPWITVDLGKEYTINKWAVRHAGSMLYSDQSKNTVDFDLMYSSDNEGFFTADEVRGNTAPVTEHEIAPVKARYVRLSVNKAAQNDDVIRIYDFAVFGDYDEDVSEVPTMDKAFMQINYTKDGDYVNANVNYPLYNRAETDANYTIVTAVFTKDGKIDGNYPLQVLKKTVAPAFGSPKLEDITLNFNVKLPNDDQHYFKILHFDINGKGLTYKYDTIVR